VKAKELINEWPVFTSPKEFWENQKKNIFENSRFDEDFSLEELVKRHQNVIDITQTDKEHDYLRWFLCFWYYPSAWSSRALSSYLETAIELGTGKITKEIAESINEEGGKYKYNNPNSSKIHLGSWNAYHAFNGLSKDVVVKALFEADLKDNNEISKPDQKQIDYVNHIYKD